MAIKDFIDLVGANWMLAPLLLLAVWILFVIIRAAAWRLFSFDRRVSEILSQKKSSEVRLGKISEVLAPLLDSFPVDVKKPGTSTVFIGQPIDFIHFDPDEGVTFIEVKSGNSALSSGQRKLKEQILSGRIEWREVKVK